MEMDDALSRGQARAELAEWAHHACHPALHTVLATALSHEANGERSSPGTRVQSALLRAAPLLPSPEELLDDAHLFADLQAAAAVRDPGLYMAIVNHYVLCSGSIAAFGQDEQALRPYRQALRNGEAKGVYLVTEIARAGSHLAPETVADYQPETGEFVLNTPGTAMKFSSVARSGPRTVAVVCARTLVAGRDHGVFPFLVDLTGGDGPLPGVELSHPLELGSLPLDYALVRFHDLRVPKGRWLSDTARITPSHQLEDPCPDPAARLRRTMSIGQVLWGTIPLAMAAMAREGVVAAMHFAAHRVTTGHPAPGTPLLSLGTHQKDLYAALAELVALMCTADQALRTLTNSGRTVPTGPATAAVNGPVPGSAVGASPWVSVDPSLALLKAVSTELATRILHACQRHCGLAGYLNVNGLQGWRGAADAFTVAGGDNQVIFLDAGRLAITSGQPTTNGTDREDTDPSDLRWWTQVLRRHEEALTERLQHRTRNAHGNTLDLWNPLLVETRELGETVGARMVAECLVSRTDSTSSPLLKAALRKVALLFGAVQAHRQVGWLLTTGALSASQARTLPQHVHRLCAEAETYVPLLVDGLTGPPTSSPPTPLIARNYTEALWPSEDTTRPWTSPASCEVTRPA